MNRSSKSAILISTKTIYNLNNNPMSKIIIDNGIIKITLEDLTSEEARALMKKIYISITLNSPVTYSDNKGTLILPYKLLAESIISIEPPIPDFLNQIPDYDSQA